METPAELMDLNRILLNLARSRDFPNGSSRHGYDFIAPNPDDDEDDEAGYKFGTHAFLPDEYVSIGGQGGKLHTFRVISVDPVVLSVALIKSFRLNIKV
jgi:hypothetical protein